MNHQRDRTTSRGSAPGVFLGALLVVVILATFSSAGDYHTGLTLRCNDCHVMHFSESHGYDTGSSGGYLGTGPTPYLLRSEINDLCLSCHDGGGMGPDVLGDANTGTEPGTVRLGGYLNRFGGGGSDLTGHTLDSLEPAPGSSPIWRPEDENGFGRGLTCINCHASHGDPGPAHPTGSQYRNLRSDPGTSINAWVTYNHESPGTNNLSRDVFVRELTSYDESRVDWNEPDSQDSAIARWCGGCHHFAHDNAMGGGGGGMMGWSGFLREHPVLNENLGSEQLNEYLSHTNRVKVMSEVGIWNPAGGDTTPTCITCHKSHGNGIDNGLIYRSGTGVLTEDGDTNGTTLDDLCRQCHAEGSAFH